jgi:hypothetical protein
MVKSFNINRKLYGKMHKVSHVPCDYYDIEEYGWEFYELRRAHLWNFETNEFNNLIRRGKR